MASSLQLSKAHHPTFKVSENSLLHCADFIFLGFSIVQVNLFPRLAILNFSIPRQGTFIFDVSGKAYNIWVLEDFYQRDFDVKCISQVKCKFCSKKRVASAFKKITLNIYFFHIQYLFPNRGNQLYVIKIRLHDINWQGISFILRGWEVVTINFATCS